MRTKAVRAVISILAIGAAASVLLFTTMRANADYYKHVDEVMPNAAAWYGKHLQLHGFVVNGSVETIPNTLDYRFKLQNNNAEVLATYTGIVPDTFKDGAEVVLTGSLHPDGFHVDANGVTAKCPSKYDPDKSTVAQNAPGQS